MALIIPNLVTPFIKGLLGNIVFKRRNGVAYAAMQPIPSNQPPSAGQLEAQQRFREAAHYAKGVMSQPVLRAHYESVALAEGKSVFNLASTDFFKPPLISRINLEDYKGHIGEKIVVTALDVIEVASVTIVIRSSAGAVLEEGAAIIDSNFWTYTATTNVAAGQNVTVEVTAKDYPGNVATGSAPYHQP